MDNRTPKFCANCGTRLVGSEHVRGYDPYTGEPEAVQSFRCPNPTVTVTGSGFKKRESTTYHPTWNIVDGVWASS